ncbi:MAG: AAA family ATPase [Clostridiales bacterium]|nr:AAA family ATPase [Clostridiales bacterium]
MNKEMEFQIESSNLLETLRILDKEILESIVKRKQISEYIVNSRKEYLEEYKDDEDKIIDYFDHEEYAREEAYRIIDKQLKELTILKESPYFGKITISYEDLGVLELYIGRFGVTIEGKYEPVIVDWRAPVASLFYKGTLGDAEYNTPDGIVSTKIVGRRQLIIKKGELKGVFDSAIDVKDEILQMVLTSNSGDSLKDIVMTIQKEQDEIIRAPKDKVVVVNGVAGSGKTTIALHRVSYLLYNFRKQFGDKVLILGPNDIFMDYISQVLPTLGEDGVCQKTFETFMMEELEIGEDIISFSKYIEDAIQGNESALEDYKYKGSSEFIKILDNTILKMNKDYFQINAILFFGEEIVSKVEIEDMFNNYYSNMPLFRRSEKIKRILTSKIKDKRDELVRKLNNEIKKRIEELSPEELAVEKVNIDFTRRIKIREIIREVMNARNYLDSWINHEDVISIYKKITNTNKLGYMDLSGIMYLMVKLQGKKCSKKFKHIVIDEAQDYTMTQFKLLKELTGCKSYTIVGDTNQRLIEIDEEPAMLHLEELFEDNCELYKLNKSYRSTQQIMEYANKFLHEKNVIVPFVRKGEAVLEEETTDNIDTVETIISIIEDYREEGLENIAVIARSVNEINQVANELKERIKIQIFNHDDMIYNGGNVLIPAYYAKGLEFDGVILLDELNNTKDLVKYIMCTRALHRLSVIKNIASN